MTICEIDLTLNQIIHLYFERFWMLIYIFFFLEKMISAMAEQVAFSAYRDSPESYVQGETVSFKLPK